MFFCASGIAFLHSVNQIQFMNLSKSIASFLLSASLLFHFPAVHGDVLSEYRLKAVFLYNFIAFAEWPSLGSSITLCFYENHPFGAEVDALSGRRVNEWTIHVAIKKSGEALQDCHALFISSDEIKNLPAILEALDHKPILTIADSTHAAAQGVILNMQVENEKITFEANLAAARNVGLTLSSRLLRLATKVYQ